MPITDLLSAKMKSILLYFVLTLLIIWMILAPSWYFQTEAGYTYYYQNTLTGTVSVYTQPGVHLRVPLFSQVTPYKQVMTVAFGSDDEEVVTRSRPFVTVRFADTYTGDIPATFRFRLPNDIENIKNMHQDFRNFENLIDALLVKTARDVVVNTATQYTGEEFFQGGLNQFKAALADQLRNGIYKTERKQVEVEQVDLAPVGLGQEESTQLRKTTTLVWKTVPVLDENGQVIRLENPLSKYNIEATQVTIDSPLPEEQLEQLLMDKKRLVAERIKTVQEQETAKAQAKTAQLVADIERTKAKQEALKQKELAVIAKQREVEEAQKQAEKEIVEQNKLKEIAAINKVKELEIARAEREIQQANYESAQSAAKAIRERGLAEADVLKAMYEARIPKVYLAELRRDMTEIIYRNLQGITVTMPRNVVNLGGEKGHLPTNLDVLSSFATLATMEKLSEKVGETVPEVVEQTGKIK